MQDQSFIALNQVCIRRDHILPCILTLPLLIPCFLRTATAAPRLRDAYQHIACHDLQQNTPALRARLLMHINSALSSSWSLHSNEAKSGFAAADSSALASMTKLKTLRRTTVLKEADVFHTMVGVYISFVHELPLFFSSF
jgi:hypothetical protein